MSDESKQEQAPGIEFPPVNPQYQPAKTDSRIMMSFFGNTPDVAELRTIGISPGHLISAAHYLQRQAEKMYDEMDRKLSLGGIQVPGGPPPGIIKP